MDGYTPKGGRIFGGIFLLILSALVLWFMAEGFLIYTPFAKSCAVRGIGGYYVEGKVIKLKRDSDGDVHMVVAEYQVGFQKVTADLPAHLWYYEGIEEGDKMAVPYHQKSFENMRREERIILTVSVIVFAIFLIWSISLFAGEIAASRYFHKLISNKTYINTQFKKTEEKGNRVRAVSTYCDHVFKSKWYSKERYPFECGGDIRVYVNLPKNPDKYFVSEK